ncbi:erythromycin esterase family protein [Microbacterium sp. PMB16]|uniref:erythromycin esterase family protein n=1 Tax=Microbacterium sp. PMB16 TaxID=3120157 RepID=UPI003F4C3EF1
MSAQTASFVRPIPAIELPRPEFPDSDAVRALIGDARVIALGEGAHNIAEFTAYGHALLRMLVEEFGVTAFVMESGFAEGLLVDEWIRGGDGAVDEIARAGIAYGFGESEGIRRQLTWMREWNAAGGGIRFYGMDLPGSSTSPGPAVRACLARIPSRANDAEIRLLSDLGGRTEAAVSYAAMPAEERLRLVGALREVIDRVEAEGDDIAHRCAESIAAFLGELAWDGEPGPYPREAYMARTARWIADREERILIYAHNGHVRRTPLEGRATVGSLLGDDLGDELRVVGMTFGAGPVVTFTQRSPRPFDCDVALSARTAIPGTIEERLDARLGTLGAAAAIVDLAHAAPELFDGCEGMLASGALERVDDFPASFDALIHLRHASAVPGAFERLREEFDAPQSGRSR